MSGTTHIHARGSTVSSGSWDEPRQKPVAPSVRHVQWFVRWRRRGTRRPDKKETPPPVALHLSFLLGAGPTVR
ncbi:hypothetical protein MGG_17490 [Pyricularia oryzae 70-15]|uniref:Uncharacterized protein n=3 Tax=Pyricularia oryzae TaxID=318829 RepID=G4NDI2_PYRO7|nr:uncharacterized protein MGG_17490 [Pyricularia oryzae 70-15]EHA49267.1 hypothetical protein MGG_17490 [Pyricularia oryzae 70-15]ELQ36000.1 hypothetical protein OOU_Y34scaffold00672g18 [Pyricularia oryzae Y34]KAI7914873.1 hypothetical protein M9X92_008749 [Pyricularia oryzae]KAI7917478.1 hypothetical protein M0657_008068 [Pyricularia oryzae]